MIEELRERLPEELVWNALKYTTHPLAEILSPLISLNQDKFKGASKIYMSSLRCSTFYVGKEEYLMDRCNHCEKCLYKNNRYDEYICKVCYEQEPWKKHKKETK